MKTAISVPDDTFTRADRRAAALRMSRSEFYTRAVQRYLEQLDSESITAQIDEVADLLADDDSGQLAVTAGRRRLARDSVGW